MESVCVFDSLQRWPSFGAVDTRGLTESADQGSYSIANGPNSDVNGEFLELRGPVDVEEGQQFRVSYSEALLGDIAGVTTAEVFFEGTCFVRTHADPSCYWQ